MLFGISYGRHLRRSSVCTYDYKTCAKNQGEMLFNPPGDIFLSTYASNASESIKAHYSPVAFAISGQPSPSNKSWDAGAHHERNIKFLNGLELVRSKVIETKRPYDVIVATRFDVAFRRPWRWTADCIYVASQLEKSKFIDDNVYAIPGIYLEKIIDTIRSNIRVWSHTWKHMLESVCRLCFMYNERRPIDSLEMYKIVRNCTAQHMRRRGALRLGLRPR